MLNELKLWADFNEASNGTIWTSLRRTEWIPSGEPWVGQRVMFRDREGNVCEGIVTKVNYPIVYAELDLDTWIEGISVQIESEYHGPVAYDFSEGSEDRTTINKVKQLAVG
jgi:hypothetical protein